MDALTKKQERVLKGIYDLARKRNLPPTVREIGQRLGLSSTCTVYRYLEQLERKGYIKRGQGSARSLEIINAPEASMLPPSRSVPVPLIGTVTAGTPITAVEHVEEVYSLPEDLVPEGCFMLRVRGDSMVGAGIDDGDLSVIRPQKTANNGDIVCALLDDEATIKRFYRDRGSIRLQPENDKYDPIRTKDATVLGKVILAIKRVH